MAVNRQFPQGAWGQELSLMSENGCQPTVTAFMQTCTLLGIEQAFTSNHNPKGNADTKRMRHPLKEACLWLHEWTCPFTFASALKRWIADYNERDLHSALATSRPHN
jgi:putative transposase